MLEKINSELVRQTGRPYSPGIRVGNLLFLAGRGPFDIEGNLVSEDFAEQARATFASLEVLANEAGTSLKKAVRVGAYLSSMDYFDDLNRVMFEFVEEPYPVRTTIPVELRGFHIEADAIVAIP